MARSTAGAPWHPSFRSTIMSAEITPSETINTSELTGERPLNLFQLAGIQFLADAAARASRHGSKSVETEDDLWADIPKTDED